MSTVTSTVQFCGVELLTAPDTLRPREETELLARTALDLARDLADAEQELRLIDLCCGSGNLACALAVHIPRARVWASDLTPACSELTARNVAQLGLGERVTVANGDLFAPLAELRDVDLVVCNPPYISAGKLDGESAHLLDHEPRAAFDGGAYGLTIHQRVLKAAPDHLRPGGWLLFEIGLGQERQVQILFERARAFDEVRMAQDEEGHVRVVYGRRRAA